MLEDTKFKAIVQWVVLAVIIGVVIYYFKLGIPLLPHDAGDPEYSGVSHIQHQ